MDWYLTEGYLHLCKYNELDWNSNLALQFISSHYVSTCTIVDDKSKIFLPPDEWISRSVKLQVEVSNVLAKTMSEEKRNITKLLRDENTMLGIVKK